MGVRLLGFSFTAGRYGQTLRDCVKKTADKTVFRKEFLDQRTRGGAAVSARVLTLGVWACPWTGPIR